MGIMNFLFGDICEVCTKRSHGELKVFKGAHTCSKCIHKREFADARVKAMVDDPVIKCPSCSTTMVKNFMFDDDLAIRDKCPSCETVVFSKEEIEAIKEHSYSKGYRSGKSDGHSSGAMTGFVMGSIIN